MPIKLKLVNTHIKFRIIIYVVMLFTCASIVLEACKHKEENAIIADKYTIQLKWNKAYNSETKEVVEKGFLWALCFLGANLPKTSFSKSLSWKNEVLTVNFYRLGFKEHSLNAISKVLVLFKQSEEYQTTGAIDIGRFISLTINSSNHYYAITGIATSFPNFTKTKVFDSKKFAATNSTISNHDRVIYLPDSTNTDYKNDAYVAEEYNGKINEVNAYITSYEVAEQMENGQFRFAIYDTIGKLLTASYGPAGKPAKCLWCHETNIQRLFADQIDEPSYYGAEQFKYIIKRNNNKLTDYRNTLQSDIDFNKKQDHTFSELLYISFMEPSAERLALEWNLSIIKVKEKLAGLPTHVHSEFGYLGQLYFRAEIDHLAPYSSIKPPTAARDKSVYEPNLLN